MEISGFLSLSFARLAAALMLAVAPALAWAEPGSALDAVVAGQVKKLALAASQQAGTPARIEIEVGRLDRRLRLAPCQQITPYLPPGTRLWGKARIGLRCTEGASRWNVYLPITVKVFGQALVARAPLDVGSVVTGADLIQAEVDLAEESSMAVVDTELAVGRTMARALDAGQSLRQAHLKARQWFAAGDMVKVVALGAGFSVAGVGQALTPGMDGQPARVRSESGRVLTGMPTGERLIELTL